MANTFRQIAQQRRQPQMNGGGGSSFRAIAQHRANGGVGVPDSVPGIPTVAAPPAPSHHSGGLLHDIGAAAHWLGKKSELAATDLKNIPAGFIQLATPAVDEAKATGYLAIGDVKDARRAAESAHNVSKTLVHGTVEGTKQTVAHPLRDPFQTLLLGSTVAGGVGGVAGRLAEAGRVIDRGGSFADVAKAAATRPAVQPRLISKNDETVALHPSKTPAVRALQAIHDHIVQHAINENPDGRVAAYGTKRIGQSIDETFRPQARMRNAPADVLDRAALRLTSPAKRVTGESRMNQAALELTSVQTPAEEAAAFHEAQAANGVNADRNRVVARLYRAVAKKGLLTTNEHGAVVVDAARFPDLAKADLALSTVQGLGDETLARYGVRTAEQLQSRVDAPAKIRAGAEYESPTPAKTGVPSQVLIKARGRVARLEALHERAIAKASEKAVPYGNVHTRTGLVKQDLKTAPEAALKRQHVEVPAGPRTPGEPSALPPRGITTPTVERLGSALSVARDDLQRLEQQAVNRVKPTGIVGGETARPGRGFVSYRLEEKRAPGTPAASSAGQVVGEARSPIRSDAFTGESIAKGYVPKDISGSAARNYRQIMRFVNTSERRNQAIRFGSAAKQTERDVLVRVPGVDHEKIPATVNDILGTSKLTVDDVNGLHAALEAFKNDLVPGLRDRFAQDHATSIGTPAPKGHVFVDRHLLGDLAAKPRGPRGLIGRQVDNVNSAVTAATVYFKIGHVGTRVLTNTATNLIQGSLNPLQIAKSNELWHELSDLEKARALAASGQHGFSAMPHEGVSLASRVASGGASWWARHADSPFRFNSIAFEARKAGFDTPEKFRWFLDKLEDPTGLDAAQTAKVEWVAKRSNREAIAYDRLSPGERNYLTGAIWFYPWVRATANFLGNTITEHPIKAGVGGALAQQAEQTQQRQLGDLPSYERGLVKVGGGQNPLVSDFSTFSPFATPADTLNVASLGQASSLLNPVYAAAAILATRQNQFGSHTNNPGGDALSALFSPTPEAQAISAYLDRHKSQGRRMFPKSPELGGTLSPLLRAVGGPATPRRINLSAAHRAAARERTGR